MGIRYIEIKRDEFQNLLKKEKGFVEQVSGNEYIYDYDLPTNSSDIIRIKIASSVKVTSKVGRNLGEDAIRVFAVLVKADKTHEGLVSADRKGHRVYRTQGWRENLREAFRKVREEAYRNYQYRINHK